MSEWKPIDSAPKDGTYLLLWVTDRYFKDYGAIVQGSFRVDGGFSGDDEPLWLKDDYNDYSCGYSSTTLTPTHWMPLPEPPK